MLHQIKVVSETNTLVPGTHDASRICGLRRGAWALLLGLALSGCAEGTPSSTTSSSPISTAQASSTSQEANMGTALLSRAKSRAPKVGLSDEQLAGQVTKGRELRASADSGQIDGSEVQRTCRNLYMASANPSNLSGFNASGIETVAMCGGFLGGA